MKQQRDIALLPIFGSPEPRKRPFLLLFLRRRWRGIVIAAFLLLWTIRSYRLSSPSRLHAITSNEIAFEASHASGSDDPTDFLPLPEAQALCGAQRWPVFNADARGPRRKIYDLFMVNNELDWVEIRMETMAKHVDYFVIVESPVTFTMLPKPLTISDNWDRFAKFHKQIIYKVLENPPYGARLTWDYEDHQRNAMFTQVFPRLQGEQAASPGDVVIVSDVDEIVRPAALLVLRNCDFPKRLTLRSQFFYYGFQFLHKGLEWQHPQATTFQGTSDTILPANLRAGEGGSRVVAWRDKADLWNAGWHCSSCFATIEDLLTKMKSFSHMSLNLEKYRDRDRIIDRVRNGLDLWDRKSEFYEKIPRNKDIPEILKSEPARFSYLFDREGPNAGFQDVPATGN
ncbi:Beta-1,4-mannosyl-glycoprotein 4-beta-N-acetylglucosaminyltransferase [Drechslerella dactyloides]|uniref:Beta-1,4-mannosyl-glycoprotein 4-beta-N-acetylglucosaminyltransferase n=1 Tax=Drechslerella dactyloides TaxID=74499 RepID=A0AAD6IY04_DREDA|nr:Beta-1,4-mannosyl-glycoprotein 4-beta-N-acetylglucosaminyltransferase [Drechslerella dactyloides]